MELRRYAAFTADPAGGNPAGVVLDAGALTVTDMARIAAEVGFSETAFLVARRDPADFDVRYFSPVAEVPFCGHATIAAAVALTDHGATGPFAFHTAAGTVPVDVTASAAGTAATLTSVAPRVEDLADRDRLLAALRIDPADLDPSLPVRVAYAGAFHPIVAVATRRRLAALDYDFGRLKVLMAERDWTTVDVVWRESSTVFHARNPFPAGGIVEDPATGAAAAALGGYLRALGLVEPPVDLVVHQGDEVGRPSVLGVHVPVGESAGVRVTGTAVPLP